MAATPQSNTSKALDLVLQVLAVVPEVGPAVQLAASLVTTIKDLTANGQDIDPADLAPLEQQTTDLMGQIQQDASEDVKGLGNAGQL